MCRILRRRKARAWIVWMNGQMLIETDRTVRYSSYREFFERLKEEMDE